MATDYQSNSKRDKEKKQEKPKAKDEHLEPVVDTVIIKKRSFGRRVKDTIHDMDIKTVSKYVVAGVILPGLKSIVFDAGIDALRRTLYRDSPSSPGRQFFGGSNHGTKFNYQTPISRSPSVTSKYAPALEPGPRQSRFLRDDIFLSTLEDAELVLGRMVDILEMADVVTVRDLHELIGREASFVDDSWGWASLSGAQIVSTREGYYLDLPQPQPLR